jgi:tetratricopeptide (TPR) repeat protein
LGECLTRVGDYEEAERVLVEAYEILLPRGESDEIVLAAAENLRRLYERWGVPEKALPSARESASGAQRTSPDRLATPRP